MPPPAAAGGTPTTAAPTGDAAAAPDAANKASAEAGAHPPKSHLAGKPPKLTPEQKQKAYDEERKSYEEKRKRVETLAQKLRDRVRPLVEARNPGDKDDPETRRFAERMQEEARDLAMESFGVGAWVFSRSVAILRTRPLPSRGASLVVADLARSLSLPRAHRAVPPHRRDLPRKGDDVCPAPPQAVGQPARPPRVVVPRQGEGRDPQGGVVVPLDGA